MTQSVSSSLYVIYGYDFLRLRTVELVLLSEVSDRHKLFLVNGLQATTHVDDLTLFFSGLKLVFEFRHNTP